MKVLIAQFYQAIKYNGETLTRINASPAFLDNPPGDRYGRVTMHVEPGIGVRIEGAKSVVVPFNNVAYMEVEDTQNVKQEVKSKEKKA